MEDGTAEQPNEMDFTLLVEPALGLERRLTEQLHLNQAVGYRLVSGVELPQLKAEEIGGAELALALEWGRF